MNRGVLSVSSVVFFALAALPSVAADKAADPGFRMKCISTSTKMLPKGNAGAGKVEFTAEVDPAAQSVTIEGKKRSAKIDQYEVAFGGSEDAVFSISRSMKTFGLIAPVKDAPKDDSRKYLYFQGKCEAA